jgi:hypothetical protein
MEQSTTYQAIVRRGREEDRAEEARFLLRFEQVLGMEQSTTYQAIIRRGREQGREEGRVYEALYLLLLQGAAKFGPPDAATQAALESISDLGQLEELGVRLMSVGSWQELLPRQTQRRRNGRRRSKG